jgi:hypothetical protein
VVRGCINCQGIGKKSKWQMHPNAIKSRAKAIVEAEATCKTNQEIADKVGIDPKTLWRNLHREEIRKEIERLQQDYLADNLPTSIQKVTKIINSNPKTPIDKRIQAKFVERTLEAGGILPSNTQSVYITKINQANVLIQNPLVREIIDKHLIGLRSFGDKDDGVIDAE